MGSAFVTGGAGGLGRGVGAALAARGVGVAFVDLDEAAAVDAAAAVASSSGVATIGLGCDLTDPEGVARAWARARRAVGPIDVVVNGAGVFTPAPFAERTWETWRSTLAVNLDAPFLVCRQAAREWIELGTKGAIVNVASTAAYVAKDGLGAADYGASKAGLLGLTVHLAVELGSLGIRVNAVAPGRFRSPMSDARLGSPENEEDSRLLSPMGRPGEIAEIAEAIVFLALDGTYVNGQALGVDGGTLARM